jgi:hypothetical protein
MTQQVQMEQQGRTAKVEMKQATAMPREQVTTMMTELA